ncbi:MAG: flagellin FliC [Nitrospirae bacterium]|nr:flagellin FliC [Nitrospirota bacterium]
MALVINTNIPSVNAQRNLASTQGTINQAMQRLSSGLRINSAKDDAAGLAIGTKMTSQVLGLTVASRNASDGISVTQSADGGMEEMVNSLQRIRELSVQAMSGQYAATDVANIQLEVNALTSGISLSAQQTKFNNKILFDGNFNANIKVGYSASDAVVSVSIGNLSINGSNMGGTTYATTDSNGNTIAPGTGLLEDISTDVTTASGTTGKYSLLRWTANPSYEAGVSSATVPALIQVSNASNTIAVVDSAMSYVISMRSTMGAKENLFSSVVNNLANVNEATQAARSRIMDADYAAETAALTRGIIIQQAGISVLSQANTLPKNVLNLLS